MADKLFDKDGNEIKTAYIEPADFIPEELRKKYKLGEYNDDFDDEPPISTPEEIRKEYGLGEFSEGKPVSLQEAIKAAKDWNRKYDTCQEYEDAYVFFIDDGIERDGGPDSCLIIEKATGKHIPFAIYILSGAYDPVEVGEPFHIDD